MRACKSPDIECRLWWHGLWPYHGHAFNMLRCQRVARDSIEPVIRVEVARAQPVAPLEVLEVAVAEDDEHLDLCASPAGGLAPLVHKQAVAAELFGPLASEGHGGVAPLLSRGAVAAEILGPLASEGRGGVAPVGHRGAVDVAGVQVLELVEGAGDRLLELGVEDQGQRGLVKNERGQLDAHQRAQEHRLVVHDHHRRQLHARRHAARR